MKDKEIKAAAGAAGGGVVEVGHLSTETLAGWRQEFVGDPKSRLARNAVTRLDSSEVALDRTATVAAQHTFSVQVELEGKATAQKASGRCWLFAGLNVMRLGLMEKYDLEEFEFSQSYLFFWDKIEKSNYFLENILATPDEKIGSRLLSWLLADPVGDGGQWDMFINLVHKHGVVPQDAYPESHSSSSSRSLNWLVTTKLREFAIRLREQAAGGADMGSLREAKLGMLAEIHRILCIHLGEPPKAFDWQFRDKDKKFHDFRALTPRSFFAEHVDYDPAERVCLINAPTTDKPFGRLFTVQYLGNMPDGHSVRYVNLPIDDLKAAAVASLEDGEAVWFGCDVGKHFHRDLGVMDMDLYDFHLVYGTSPGMDKGERLNHGDSQMTHAMVLTGVDLEDGRPVRWRVENSWGEKVGKKGYFVMSDKWFTEYLYELAIAKRFLSAETLAILEQDPIVLPPWDPMGSLA
ncbi:C1 family peptidase [bacterium]|nr:C1 family peptidase [bacterium]